MVLTSKDKKLWGLKRFTKSSYSFKIDKERNENSIKSITPKRKDFFVSFICFTQNDKVIA